MAPFLILVSQEIIEPNFPVLKEYAALFSFDKIGYYPKIWLLVQSRVIVLINVDIYRSGKSKYVHKKDGTEN